MACKTISSRQSTTSKCSIICNRIHFRADSQILSQVLQEEDLKASRSKTQLYRVISPTQSQELLWYLCKWFRPSHFSYNKMHRASSDLYRRLNTNNMLIFDHDHLVQPINGMLGQQHPPIWLLSSNYLIKYIHRLHLNSYLWFLKQIKFQTNSSKRQFTTYLPSKVLILLVRHQLFSYTSLQFTHSKWFMANNRHSNINNHKIHMTIRFLNNIRVNQIRNREDQHSSLMFHK